ncbi:hypothetical protein [Streptomyces roseifaciens]|uniref:hypothetical protein n=1 Tax=Streptomyces roseifaciens TaxID=1488406 RepID=UPI000717EB9B|nr:hypothetical protein [Streptomyces roseifaciens]
MTDKSVAVDVAAVVVADVDELLAALDPLPHPRRVRRMALHARELSAAGALAAVLAELARRGGYERGLAGVAARAAGDVGWLRTRLADPDPYVRLQAVSAVRGGIVPDAAVAEALDDGPAAVRRELIGAVVTGRRTALADALVRPLRERWGEVEAARLLPACGPGTVAELLPGLFPYVTGLPSVRKWAALTRRHAGIVLDEVERRLTAEPEARRHDWWQSNGACVAAAIEYAPERVFDLLERLCHGPLPWPLRDALGGLMTADPGRTVRLLLAPPRDPAERLGLTLSALRTLVRRDPPELAVFAQAVSHDERALARLLRRLPPSRRAACLDTAMAGRGTEASLPPERVLASLPRARREAEARRMADRARRHGGQWRTVLECVAHLPPAEAGEELWAATRDPAERDRAEGYRLLFLNAARSGDPSVVTDRLARCTRLREEPELVRGRALYAIAAIPSSLFADEAAPHLERLAADALEAPDCSWDSRYALGGLAVSLLRDVDVEVEVDVTGFGDGAGRGALKGWALRTLERLPDTAPPRPFAVRHGREQEAFEALRPELEARAQAADFTAVLTLASCLGERAYAVQGLQDLLWRAVRDGDQDTAGKAAVLWLRDPRTHDERLVALLTLDASFATLPSIGRTLTYRRTDLLDLVLGDTPPYGRLLPEGDPWLPPVGRAARRWLPRQQAVAARALARIADDTRLPDRLRARAVALAAWLPGNWTGILQRHTASGDTEVAEAALAALARTERPGEHLSTLLAHAGGNRSRIAMAAARRAGRHVPPSLLAGALRPLLLAGGDTRVTGREEAARIAAALLPVRDAAVLLRDAYALPLHQDVRAVCLALTTGLLACEEAWETVESAAAGRREDQVAVLGVRAPDVPERHRHRYARLVAALCRTGDREVVLHGYRALAEWSGWIGPEPGTLAAAVTDLENRDTWSTAVGALCAMVTDPPTGTPDVAPLLGTLAALIAADARAGTSDARGGTSDVRGGTPDADADTDSDRPARRRVELIVGILTPYSTRRTRISAPVARRVADLLAGTPDFTSLAVRLLLHTFDPDAGPDTLTATLTHLAEVHEGRPALAASTAAHLRQALRSRNGDAEALARAARTLVEDGGYAAGLFAVALTEVGGERAGWASPWREHVRALRRHAHPDVREEAFALVMAL